MQPFASQVGTLMNGQWGLQVVGGGGCGGVGRPSAALLHPPEVVTKVAKWLSFIINTQAVDFPILPTMTSGGVGGDAKGGA